MQKLGKATGDSFIILKRRNKMDNYVCPSCGQEFDPKEGFIEYPDVYLECDCGYDLAIDFRDDILELWMANKIDRMEGDR